MLPSDLRRNDPSTSLNEAVMRRPLVLVIIQAFIITFAMTSVPTLARADGECQLKPGIPDKVKCIEQKIDAFMKAANIPAIQSDIGSIKSELAKAVKYEDKLKIVGNDTRPDPQKRPCLIAGQTALGVPASVTFSSCS